MRTTIKDYSGDIFSKLFPLNDHESTKDWLEQEKENNEYFLRNRCVVATFMPVTGGEVLLLDLSENHDTPNIAIKYKKPHISRGRSPNATILSPLELFLAFN